MHVWARHEGVSPQVRGILKGGEDAEVKENAACSLFPERGPLPLERRSFRPFLSTRTEKDIYNTDKSKFENVFLPWQNSCVKQLIYLSISSNSHAVSSQDKL